MDKSLILKVLEFLFCTFLIYACYITSGVYHQKILKHKYISDKDQTEEKFDASIVFTFFSQLICTILGWAIRQVLKHHYRQQPVHIPARNAVICSAIITLSMITYNKAVQAASFPAVVMVKSCSLLSAILVALFCSRVKEKELNLGMNKLWVGLMVSVGIFMFNYFKDREDSNNQPISWFSTSLLLVSLIGDGLLPDYQAQIKSAYKPGAIDMYYAINKYTCLISLAYATVFQQLVYISTFIMQHSELQQDLLYYSVLNAVGQLVIYRMIKLFKQHIVPFVITTRKCFTVIVNILYFGHTINQNQGIGVAMVLTAILVEMYVNYKQKTAKDQASVQLSMEDEEQMKSKVSIDVQHCREYEAHPLAGEESENKQKYVQEDEETETMKIMPC